MWPLTILSVIRVDRVAGLCVHDGWMIAFFVRSYCAMAAGVFSVRGIGEGKIVSIVGVGLPLL